MSIQDRVSVQIHSSAATDCEKIALANLGFRESVTHIVMESTGEFWKPLYQLLEGSFTILVVNAQHIKAVPGRKTDVRNAECICGQQCIGIVSPCDVGGDHRR
jgi:transposase